MNRKQRRALAKHPPPVIAGTSWEPQASLAQAIRLYERGNVGEAARLCRDILKLQPDNPDGLHFFGVIEYQGGRLDLALAPIRRALELRPDYPEALNSLGSILRELGKPGEAIDYCQRALELRPAYPEALNNQGNALMDLARRPEAIASYNAAVQLRPDFPQALSNLGHALRVEGRLEEASACFRRALQLDADVPEIHNNLGNVLKDQGHLDEAITSYRAALALKPDYRAAGSNLVLALHYSERLIHEELLDAVRSYASQMPTKLKAQSFSNVLAPERRLRLGYVSGDLHAHPVGYFLTNVLRAHNPHEVEVFCYSNSSLSDNVTVNLQAASNHWRVVAGTSDADVDAMIKRDGIDILVDLAGHTANNRLTVFAAKAAPVQVTWLGYFGTTGLAAMDYILADRFVVTPGEDTQFTEKVVRLPDSYLCFSPPDFDLPVVARSAKEVVFGCFNHWAKVSEGTVSLWSRILSDVKGSRLLLKTRGLDNPEICRETTERFSRRGVAPGRLIFEGPSPRPELLASYSRVDVALDPFPYGGGTTTAEALWMGTPVVTLRGNRWVGRVSESILQAVGLPNLVASDFDGYVRKVRDLAENPVLRDELRHSLRARMETSPLCNGPLFAASLEAAFREMWREHCFRNAT